MILSFHPIIEADENIICAGRQPDETDLAAIRRAEAVILPQGCGPSLYRMARDHCPNIFPNMDVRFAYPGKRGQIRLFRELGVAHPPTELYADADAFERRPPSFGFPSVIKLDYGGQGDTVFKADNARELADVLDRVKAYERTGQTGFLVQPFIPAGNRCLRVTVIGRRLISYWRVQPAPAPFGTSLAKGAVVDHESDPPLRAAAAAVVRDFCKKTGLQLGGFDFIFNISLLERRNVVPLALEINYFFGRTGLGGSQAYYQLLAEAVDEWLVEVVSRGEPRLLQKT